MPITPNITFVIVVVSLCPQLRLGRVQEAEEERQLRMHGEGGRDLWSWHGSCNQHLRHSSLENARNTTVQILTRPLTAARFHNSTSTTKHCLNNPSDISPFISINLFNYDFCDIGRRNLSTSPLPIQGDHGGTKHGNKLRERGITHWCAGDW